MTTESSAAPHRHVPCMLDVVCKVESSAEIFERVAFGKINLFYPYVRAMK